MKNKFFIHCLAGLCALMVPGMGGLSAQDYRLASPDGKLSISIYTEDDLQWAIQHDGTTVLLPSSIALQGRDEQSPQKAVTFGKDVKVSKASRQSVESSFATPFYKKAEVQDVYNELTL